MLLLSIPLHVTELVMVFCLGFIMNSTSAFNVKFVMCLISLLVKVLKQGCKTTLIVCILTNHD